MENGYFVVYEAFYGLYGLKTNIISLKVLIMFYFKTIHE